MNDKTKNRLSYLLSGILCLTMMILASAPVPSGGAAKPGMSGAVFFDPFSAEGRRADFQFH